MRTSGRFRDDVVDESVFKVVPGGQCQRFRRLLVGLFIGFLPENGRATFG